MLSTNLDLDRHRKKKTKKQNEQEVNTVPVKTVQTINLTGGGFSLERTQSIVPSYYIQSQSSMHKLHEIEMPRSRNAALLRVNPNTSGLT